MSRKKTTKKTKTKTTKRAKPDHLAGIASTLERIAVAYETAVGFMARTVERDDRREQERLDERAKMQKHFDGLMAELGAMHAREAAAEKPEPATAAPEASTATAEGAK
jgi:hypothetical protein